MPIPGSGIIGFSGLQNEFGGTNPVSISEYYRDPGRTTNFLLTNNQSQAGRTEPSNSTSNQSIPTSGQIKVSDFRNTRQYQLFTYSVGIFIAGPIGANSSEPIEVLLASQQISGFTWNTLWNPNITRVDEFSLRVRGSRVSDPEYFGGDDDGTWIYNPRIVLRTVNNTILYNETILISSPDNDFVSGSAVGAILTLPESTSYFLDVYATIRYIPGGSAAGNGGIVELTTPIDINVAVD